MSTTAPAPVVRRTSLYALYVPAAGERDLDLLDLLIERVPAGIPRTAAYPYQDGVVLGFRAAGDVAAMQVGDALLGTDLLERGTELRTGLGINQRIVAVA